MFENIVEDIQDIFSETTENPTEIHHKLLEFIDLTSLNDDDTEESIRNLCALAKKVRLINENGIASVCVYPKFAKFVRRELENTGISVACVAGNFPSGEGNLPTKLDEVKYALNEGAQEIDYVVCKQYIPSKEYDKLFEEIHAVKQICGNIPLKIILETGELQTIEEIYEGSKTAIEAGADFIKTSTGKTPIGVTPVSAYVMLKTIEEYYQKTEKLIGFKASGGVSEPEQAAQYYMLAKEILTKNQVNKNTFRIGASRLVSKLLEIVS